MSIRVTDCRKALHGLPSTNTMIRVLLDTNIYDKLAVDRATINTIAEKIAQGVLEVVVSPIIMGELKESHFQGMPTFFPVTNIPEGVAVVGYAIVGLARPSEGVVYNAHRGDSKKAKDAIIAETADSDCDLLVSEDNRCRTRLNTHAKKCKAVNFQYFKELLRTL